MGKKKWTGPNERKRQHMHHAKAGRGGRHGPRRGAKSARGGGDVNPLHQRQQRDERQNQHDTEQQRQPRIVGLCETQVGITEFVGTQPGFTGIIKARFSDFHVNEIDQTGQVVRLTDQSLPKPPKVDVSALDDNERQVIEMVTLEKWQRITEVAASDPKLRDSVEIDVHALTKEQRSLIHNTSKAIFGSDLIGSTFDRDGRKHIKLARWVKGARDTRSKWLLPGEYTYFVLYKENCDTMRAASDLAGALNAPASVLAYAGTKDKRAKTAQLMCVRKREPEKIARAAERLPHVHVGGWRFAAEPLRLGALGGNQFRLALRQCSADAETVDAALTGLRESGFINYYGMQRFGNCAQVPTHHVGLALLRGQFAEAVDLIMQPRGESEPTFMRALREHWWEHRDAAAALKMLYRSNGGVEARLLAGLNKNGKNDFVNALENVPRNLRLMYVHAWQSLVWNEVASKRVARSREVLVGDLVYVSEAAAAEADKAEIEEIEEDERLTLATDAEAPAAAAVVVEEAVVEEPEEEVSRFRSMVRQLTAEDVASGRYELSDVVLPLPGFDITYPGGEMAEWYAERLAVDGLSSEQLKTKQKVYSLTGAYRKILVRPAKLSWRLVRHASDTDTLIRSDLEELRGEPEPAFPEDGVLRALLVQFELPSSTYATMVLREILKADTSPANQAKLGLAETAKAEAEAAAKLEELAAAGAAKDGEAEDEEDEDEDDNDDEEDADEDEPTAKKAKAV